MIQMGRVEDNRMVNMKLLNKKMVDRSVKMLMERSGMENYEAAKEILLKYGSVRAALDHIDQNGEEKKGKNEEKKNVTSAA
jgi:N-acetylmuramic acid 6-phosphate etherase